MEAFLKAQYVVEAAILLLIALLSVEKTLRKGEHCRLFLVAFLSVSALYLIALGLGMDVNRPVYIWAEALKAPLSLAVIPLFFLFISAAATSRPRTVRYIFYQVSIPLAFLLAMPVFILFSYLDGNLSSGRGYIGGWTLAGQIVLLAQTVFYTLMFFLRFRIYSRRLQDYYSKVPESANKFRYLIISFSVFFLFTDSWLMSSVLPDRGFQMMQSLLIFLAAGFTGWFGLNLELYPAKAKEASPEIIDEAPVAVTELTVEEEVIQPAPEISKEVVLAQEDTALIAQQEPDDKPRRKAGAGRKPFDDQQKRALYKRMLNHLITNELYTDPKLTLKQLANDLGTNTRYLSMVINEYQGRNFNQMLNYYRVKKVMRLLVDNEAESYSYLGLAQKAGFHSKSVFISAFKSQTGTTPSEFSGTMKKLIKS